MDNAFAEIRLDEDDILISGDVVEYSSAARFKIAHPTIGKKVDEFPSTMKFFRNVQNFDNPLGDM